MTEGKKLFLLDAYALIFRAYYAFISNPMSNSKGVDTSTIFGFLLTLDELLRKEDPTHIAVVFDPPGPTFRHEMYPAYKANREATPEAIKSSVPYIKKLIEGYNIRIVEEPGFEADDVIGTMARRAEKEGFDVYMMTPDKDYTQLVSERIFIYKPGRRGSPPEVIGPREVKDKFLVEHPVQVVDILALWGDSSDNIPGARGIGEKTAKKLINQFHSVESLYDQIDKLKGKQKENLESCKDEVFLSKTLATISLDVPVHLETGALKRREINRKALLELFNELEFKNIASRILGEAPEASAPSPPTGQGTLFATAETDRSEEPGTRYRNIETVPHQYELIHDLNGVKTLSKQLASVNAVCLDTETTGLDPIEAEIVGIAFSWQAHRAYYVSFGSDQKEVKQWLKTLTTPLQDRQIKIIGQNLKYDLHILKNYGIEIKGELYDTMIAHFLLHPEQKHNLNVLAEQYLDYSMVKIEELIGKKGPQQASFRSVDPEKASEYAGEDADITFQLAGVLDKKLEEKGLNSLALNIEMPLVRVLMQMEHHGIRLDVEALNTFADQLRKEIIETEAKIHEMAGSPFNISSPRQLGEILFEKLKIVKDPKKTKTKQYATGEEVLLQLRDKHPIIPAVLEYRSLRKLLSTYVDALPKLVKKRTGRIHTSFNQALVTTGRLSSINPNLQNIPVREERGREIRRAFIPGEDGNSFFSADYSQIELRIMAHLSKDPQLIEAFVNNEDIHLATAAKIFGVDPGSVTREMRNRAKTANFGIIYGISAFGLSQRMQISRSEARELIDGYFKTYPGVRNYMDESIRMAREKGYVETMYGRRRYLPDILSRNAVVRGNAERNAINSPIQGSAADVIKIAMNRIQHALEEESLKSCMILQVHDELNFDVYPGELKRLKEIVINHMEKAVDLLVPLTVETGQGANWLEAH